MGSGGDAYRIGLLCHVITLILQGLLDREQKFGLVQSWINFCSLRPFRESNQSTFFPETIEPVRSPSHSASSRQSINRGVIMETVDGE